MAVLALGAGAAQAAVTLTAPKVLLKAARPHGRHHKPRHVDPRLIVHYRAVTHRWQAMMGVRLSGRPIAPATVVTLRRWRRLARRTYFAYVHPPHKRGWLCIHRYEGSWSDGGDPYWGGLQMDRGFMEFYAPKHLLTRGWANRWSPLEQMWVAERAYRAGRGYFAWPNTARYCGLI
jgi:hypothetical protein